MARMRGIKPDLYADEDLADRSIWARWIFPGLWMQADREGRLIDSPKRLKREILPYDDQDMDALLQELHDHRFIVRYEVDGQKYIWIPTFEDHQRISGSERETALNIPHWDGEASWKRGIHAKENSGRTEDALRTHQGLQKGKERNKNRKEEKGPQVASLLDFLDETYQTQENIKTWDEYVTYRKKNGLKTYVEDGIRKLAAMIVNSGIPPGELSEMINHCIIGAWQGIPPGHIQGWNSRHKSNGQLNGKPKNLTEAEQLALLEKQWMER